MPTITSVALVGHGSNPTAKRLYLSKRTKSEFSTKRFPDFDTCRNNIADNYLVVSGTGFSNFDIKLAVTIGPDPIEYRIIEFEPVGETEVHIWFAAFRDSAVQLDTNAGVGAITVTITTNGEPPAEKTAVIESIDG